MTTLRSSRAECRRRERHRDMPPLGRSCPVCRRLYVPADEPARDHPRRPSRDHILPVAWGGRNQLAGGVRNMRWMCQSCNRGRGACGHCLGALACAVAIAEDTCQPLELTIVSLGMREVDAARPRVSYVWTEPEASYFEQRPRSMSVWLDADGDEIDRGGA